MNGSTKQFDVKILLQLSEKNATRLGYQRHFNKEGIVTEGSNTSIDREPGTAVDRPQEVGEEDHVEPIEDEDSHTPIKAEHSWTHRIIQPGAKAPEFIDLSTSKGNVKQPVHQEAPPDDSDSSLFPLPAGTRDEASLGSGPPSALGADPSSDHQRSPRRAIAAAKNLSTPTKSKKPKTPKKKKKGEEGGGGGSKIDGGEAHKRMASSELSPAVTRDAGRRKK